MPVAFLVLMWATDDIDQDLMAIMEEVKAITAAKQKLRELISRGDKDAAHNAGREDGEPCVPPTCGGYRTAMMEAARMQKAPSIASAPRLQRGRA